MVPASMDTERRVRYTSLRTVSTIVGQLQHCSLTHFVLFPRLGDEHFAWKSS
jgi:hypothetical protein